MSADRPLRIAGGLLLLGVVLYFIGSVAAVPADGVGSSNRTGWVLIHLLLVVGATAILVGLPALYVRQADAAGLWGLVGFGLVFVGFLGIGVFVSTVQAILLPWVYDRASCALGCHLLNPSDGPPLYGWFFTVESLATFVGLVLAGLVSARVAVLPRGAGYLMAVAGVLAIPTVVISVPQLLALVPEVLALVAVSWMVGAMLSGRRAVT